MKLQSIQILRNTRLVNIMQFFPVVSNRCIAVIVEIILTESIHSHSMLCVLAHVMHNVPGIRTDSWAKFDYGDYIRNRLAYGVWTPPSYSPELIPPTLPVFVIYGGQDWTAPAHGVRTFIARLRQPPTVLFMPHYAHDDLTYSVTREADLFQPILSFLEANH